MLGLAEQRSHRPRLTAIGVPEGFMSGVLISDDFLIQMDHPSTFMQGFITSVYELGCLGGKYRTKTQRFPSKETWQSLSWCVCQGAW